MKRSVTLFSVVILFIAAQCQHTNVESVEFTTLTRGFRKDILITADTLKIRSEGRGGEVLQQRAISDADWELIVSSMKDVDAKEIDKLKSPSDRRAFDGARHSTLRVKSTGKTYEHTFDDEHPHASLIPLMQAILKLEGAQK